MFTLGEYARAMERIGNSQNQEDTPPSKNPNAPFGMLHHSNTGKEGDYTPYRPATLAEWKDHETKEFKRPQSSAFYKIKLT